VTVIAANDTRGPLTADHHRLILEAEPMIRRVAKRLHKRFGVERDDLAQIGREEAADPARTFDERRGGRFEDYAYSAVFGAMMEFIADHLGFTALRSELTKSVIDGLAELLGKPTRRDDGWREEPQGQRQRRAEDLHDAMSAAMSLGIAATASSNPEVETIRRHVLFAVEEARRQLAPDEQRLIALHWYEGKSLEQAGTALGMSRTTAVLRHGRALARLRARMEKWR
jgi:RNA polymerase sigma factor for flagellar operon FliA